MNRCPETRPARARIKFFRGRKEWLIRDNVYIDAFFFRIVAWIGEGALRAFMLGDFVLKGTKHFFEGFVREWLEATIFLLDLESCSGVHAFRSG